MTPSPEQLAILTALGASRRNLIIEACPGSGKTTTLALLARTLPQDGSRHVALAFAKANAEDFKTKLPYWIESSTCHSLCKSAIDACWPRAPRVDTGKCKWLLKDNFPTVPWPRHSDLLRMLSLLKQEPEWLDEDEVWELADHHGVSLQSGELGTLLGLLSLSDEDHSRIDFDDMLRFAVTDDRVHFSRYATVMLDEAQDTNGMQRAILHKLVATSTEGVRALPAPRLIVVGDPFQAIYAFRGAAANAMRSIEEEFDCDVLQLSTSWRCSQAVCAEANRILETFNL